MEKTCQCGEKFWCPPYAIERKKYCCKKCFYKYRKIPIWNKGLKGIHLSPATEFKKGVHYSQATEFKKGNIPLHPIKRGQRISPSTEFRTDNSCGEKNFKWKGESVGYFASHGWMQRKYGKADQCQNREQRILRFSCSRKSDNYDWAFIHKKGFTRNREDYIQLCHSCHLKYDRE